MVLFLDAFWKFAESYVANKQTLNNELKFHIVNMTMYVRCDESSLYSRINYVHSPDGELLRSVQQLKRCTQGLGRTRIAICQRPGADTEETGRYDLAERFV